MTQFVKSIQQEGRARAVREENQEKNRPGPIPRGVAGRAAGDHEDAEVPQRLSEALEIASLVQGPQ